MLSHLKTELKEVFWSSKAVPAFVAHAPYLSHSVELFVSLHEIDWEESFATVFCETDPPVALANFEDSDLLTSFERQVALFLSFKVVLGG